MSKFVHTWAKKITTQSTGRQATFYKIALAIGLAVAVNNTANAALSEKDVQAFEGRMMAAANAKSMTRVSNLIADDALISISRNGRTSTLDKAGYLKLLQSNWSKTQQYNYTISINNVLLSGNQAKADVMTSEVVNENGKTMRLVTSSRATFNDSGNGAVLSRSISQLTIK